MIARQCSDVNTNLSRIVGSRRGVKGGTHPSLEFEKNDVICCRPTKYPNILALAFGARHRYPILQSKTSQTYMVVAVNTKLAVATNISSADVTSKFTHMTCMQNILMKL